MMSCDNSKTSIESCLVWDRSGLIMDVKYKVKNVYLLFNYLIFLIVLIF